ncbi:AraC family transcriptional regulator [Brenneria sp. g21c3]|uniref:AraC family transcriptional regulator n=1 Tax=Brenneria sp. g21c3 TaxID=3093893 RepID=UPI002EC4D461|nr:AraC family transcriptional regulator [Brenneria sp. g21c3]
MIRVEQGAHNFIDPPLDETILALPLLVESQCNWLWTINGRTHKQKAHVGQMLVVPAGIESQWEVDGNRTMLVLTLPNETVRKILGGACPDQIGQTLWQLSENTWSDPLVETLLSHLWENSAGQNMAQSYLADGLLITILSQLLIRADADLASNTSVILPQWRIKRVNQFVNDNISNEISIDDLAEAAGLSRRHFARSFQQKMGETPHRWLMNQRLEKAKTLLLETHESICDIAHHCGFSSQSHLTTVLKQVTGMTPARWRLRFKI